MTSRTRISLTFASACVAIIVIWLDAPSSKAGESTAGYRYCAFDRSGATVCYFNSRTDCLRAGSGNCIGNQLFDMGAALRTMLPHRRSTY